MQNKTFYTCIILFFMLFFTSCNNCKNTSIFEEIPEHEIMTKCKDDSLFIEIYSVISEKRDLLNSLSTIEKSKYYDITYNDLCKMQKKCNSLSEKEHTDYENKWKEEFGIDVKKLDSISNSYKQKIKEIESNPNASLSVCMDYLRNHQDGNRRIIINYAEEYVKNNMPEILKNYWENSYFYESKAIKELIDEKYVSLDYYYIYKEYPHIYDLFKIIYNI